MGGRAAAHALAVVTFCSYIQAVKVSRFDWDAGNVSKVEAHDVSPEEVECLFIAGDPVFRRHSRTHGRALALGFVPDGRFVLVVFSYNKRRKAVRVITAYGPTEPEWRIKYEALKR
jgi:uncharacterized DUF497 family protein